jgi:hypothetical protein
MLVVVAVVPDNLLDQVVQEDLVVVALEEIHHLPELHKVLLVLLTQVVVEEEQDKMVCLALVVKESL